MKVIFSLLLAAALACAQQFQSTCFRAEAFRWTNHDFPDVIRRELPVAPVPMDGVQLFLVASCANVPAQVSVQIRYTREDGERRVYTDIAVLTRDEQSGEVRGYLIAPIGRGVTVRAVAIVPMRPTDIRDVEVEQ